MKFLTLFWLAISFAACCKKEPEISNTDCIEQLQNPNFKTEDLNQDYTIQFPLDYTGDGLSSTSLISFRKEKDNAIKFYYTFNPDIEPNFYYGQKLIMPIPNKFESPSQLLIGNLPQKREFCIEGRIVCILYFSQNGNNVESYGKLFLEHNEWYYEALNITFKNEPDIDEIIEVVKTIKKK